MASVKLRGKLVFTHQNMGTGSNMVYGLCGHMLVIIMRKDVYSKYETVGCIGIYQIVT